MNRLKVGDRVKGRASWGHPANRDLVGDVVLMVPAKKKLTNREMNIYAKLKDFAEPNYKSVQGPAGVDRVVVRKDDGHFVILPQDKVLFAAIPPVQNARQLDLPRWAIMDEMPETGFEDFEQVQSRAIERRRGSVEFHPLPPEEIVESALTVERLRAARDRLQSAAPNELYVREWQRHMAQTLANQIDNDMADAFRYGTHEISATEAIERNRQAEIRYQERRRQAGVEGLRQSMERAVTVDWDRWAGDDWD